MIARTGQGRKAFSFVADRSFAQNRLHIMTKKTVIDEELVRRAIGNTPSILDADPPPFDERIIKTVEDSDEAPQAAERRRRILLPDFERRFMARTEIRFRAAIYVDAETKRKKLQDDYRGKFANPYRAAELGYVDEVIDPAITRLRLIRSFEMLANKRQSNPPKKHSNIPL